MIKRLWFGGLARARIYRRLILREQPLTQSVSDLSARVPVCVSLLATGEIDDYIAFRPEQSPAEIRRRLDEGQQCFAVWHDRRIIHATWAVTERAAIAYLSMEVALAPDEVYVHDAFTSPEFRGLGASPARLREMMRYYRDRGYRCLLGAVLPENKASLRLSEGVGGYRHIGVIGYVGLGPWRHVFCRMERDASPPGRARRAP